MKLNAYPQTPPYTWEKVDPIFNAPYTLSTHLFPACYLRTTRPVPVPEPPSPNASKEERRRILKATELALTALRGSTVTDGHPWCYGLDERNRTGITLFFAHANGFPKEIWEPTLAHLLSSPIANIIDEVWLWESIQHGDAALVNAPAASGLFDSASNAKLPTHLSRVPQTESDLRSKQGFSNRKLVVVGHSYGGCTSTLAASFFPALFHTLILIDPVVVEPYDDTKGKSNSFVGGALSRRETWSSREEALQSFQSNPFFTAWDPAVLKIYVECGLHTSTSGSPIARLKMPGVQEAAVFSEIHTEIEAFGRLSRLDERIALRWIMPGKPGARSIGLPETVPRRVWVRPANSSNTRILGGGHLIPQEAPRELAEDLNEYLLERLANL
ncbi:hypothetical protein CPB84DRAFT_1775707 [Gymnopilus junonius]|uniref:AB hydrolase-1 domain-containing protein n=1 Tax=Gymnopilus junonius TaxID=109634 RepID=A0A9P5TP48_GYMJU|nr:hypothetical protein CPB84DRAFT_1775707 [Gymnopilus junonius]